HFQNLSKPLGCPTELLAHPRPQTGAIQSGKLLPVKVDGRLSCEQFFERRHLAEIVGKQFRDADQPSTFQPTTAIAEDEPLALRIAEDRHFLSMLLHVFPEPQTVVGIKGRTGLLRIIAPGDFNLDKLLTWHDFS